MKYKMMESMELIIIMLMSMAFLTLAESKLLGSMQSSSGPNKMGMINDGLLQPMSDGMKLLIKEMIMPIKSNNMMYMLAPLLTMMLSMMLWSMMPFNSVGDMMYDDKNSMLLLLAMSSLNIYGLMYSGWSSNSKYSLMGSMSSMAQLMSYEMSMGMMMMNIMMMNKNYNFMQMIKNQMYENNFKLLFPIFFLFFFSGLAETNSHPFDLIEAESELVAGMHVEYSGFLFASMHLAEYGNILIISILSSILFFGNYFILFTLFFSFLFIWMSATLPSLSYDQLMNFGWCKILPLSMGYLFFISSI